MGISREMIRAIEVLVRPLATRTANMIARGVVKLAADDKKLQLLQVGILAGETVDNAEHFQQYGFSSVPLAGAEVVVLFPGGDRSHPLVIATGDRSSRPTGGQPGEVVVYNKFGAKVTLTKDGDIVATAAPGRTMTVDDGSGAAVLPTFDDLDSLATALSGAGVGTATNVPAAIATWRTGPPVRPVGTKVLKAK